MDLFPIYRIEHFLDAIVSGTTPPEPVAPASVEFYLAKIAGADVQIPAFPISRVDHFLAKICGQNVTLPVPQSREERYLAKIAGEDVEIPPFPINRIDFWLAEWASGSGGELVTVTGVSPLLLVNSLAHSIKSLTQYGKCEQRNLPPQYTELDYLQSDGDQYIDLDTTLNQDDVIEIEFEITASQNSKNIFGYRAGASANNIMLFFGSTSNRVFIDFNNSDYAPYRLSCDLSVNTRYKAVISKSRRAILAADGTVLAENTTACPDTITCPNAYLFAAAGTPAYNYGSPCKVYSCRINGKRNLVGAKDASNVVEMYDKVTAAPFVNAGTGSFTAGPVATPTPTTPMDIVTNNGKIKYSANMANVNAQTSLVGYYISAQGAVTADTNNWMYQAYIPVKPNTTYTLSFSQSVYYVSISEYSTAEDSGFVVRKNGATGSNTSLTITTGATTNYIRFGTNINRAAVTLEQVLGINWMLNLGNTAMSYQPYVEGGIYTDGTDEVLTVSALNLINAATNTQGAYISSSGVVTTTAAEDAQCTDFIPVEAGKTYTWSLNSWRSNANGTNRWHGYKADKTWSRQIAYKNKPGTQGQLSTLTATIPDGIAYVRLSYGNTDKNVVFEEGSAVSQPQTVSDIPMLLSVGDYKDEAELISGPKTVRIGVKVFKGDDTWTVISGTFATPLTTASASGHTNLAPMCEQFKGVNGSVAVSNMAEKTIKIANSTGLGATAVFIKDSSFADSAALNAHFAAHPCILIYVLTTATTEQGAAHHLNSYDGATSVTAQTAVDPMTLSAEYMAGAA